jgi:hypothetical protein
MRISCRPLAVSPQTEYAFSGEGQHGADYLKTNGKGYVPAIELDDAQVLTEVIESRGQPLALTYRDYLLKAMLTKRRVWRLRLHTP